MIRATSIHPRPSERDLMIPLLLLTRAAIIGWTTMAVLPLEIAFDLIEGELDRSGVAPRTSIDAYAYPDSIANATK